MSDPPDSAHLLAAHFTRLRGLLEGHADAGDLPAPPALARLVTTMGLTPFERDVLLWCVGAVLDPDLAAGDAKAYGPPRFGAALAAFPDPSWRALTPTAPLRSWRLIEIQHGAPVTVARLDADERVIHHMLGSATIDVRLMPYVERLAAPAWLPPALSARVEEIAAYYHADGDRRTLSDVPGIVLLAGSRTRDASLLAASACARLQVPLFRVALAGLPAAAEQRDTFRRLWQRETLLSPAALLIDTAGVDSGAGWLADSSLGPVFVTGIDSLNGTVRPVVRYEVQALAVDDRRIMWQRSLGPDGANLNGQIDETIAHFALGPTEVEQAATAARRAIRDGQDTGKAVWRASRALNRPRLGELAESISSQADWRQLILPDREIATLRLIAANVRRRHRVYHEWEFARQGPRGLGISALFCGPSGTGKTLAAEVLAHDLDLDLYRIDLSAVVSKYIGETEKNLRAVFDAADSGGAILLFDEADALFGKRSEVRDSHDRYANIEVSYLLQRMEGYQGLAILTTNMRSALDEAFLRRLRFVVQFPFPSAEQRTRIWQTVFPRRVRIDQLDPRKLAQLNVSGGSIRNIALGAAFLAADEDAPIRMEHVRRAAESEYSKLERTLTAAETGGWV
jgi:hypothetical protein